MDTDRLRDLACIALESHQKCKHEPAMCYLLISAEIGFRLGSDLTEDEFRAVGTIIADLTIESLILKGFVEPVGISEEGDMLFGVTEAGSDALDHSNRERKNNGK